MSYPVPLQRNGAVFAIQNGSSVSSDANTVTRVCILCALLGVVTLGMSRKSIKHLSCPQEFVVIFNNLSLILFMSG